VAAGSGKADILFKAEFDATGAVTGLRKVKDEASATKQKTDSAGASFKGMALAVAAASAVLKLGAFLKDCAGAAMEAERSAVKMNAVYKATGGVVGLSSRELSKLADEMQATTGISGELVQEAEAVLLTFRSIQGEAFPRTMKAAADLSAVFGQDLNGSVTMLGKALEDPVKGITAMTRVGVTFSEEQKKMIAKMVETNDLAGAQAEILKVVELQVGGTAEALGGTLSGQLTILSETWGDAKEAIGGFVLEAVNASGIVPTLTGFLGGLTEGLNELMGKTSATRAEEELTAHALETLIGKRKDQIKALQDEMRETDHSSQLYETQKGKLIDLIEELRNFEKQLPETVKQETAAAEATKRVGDEAETAKPKVTALGDLLDVYFSEGKTYSASVGVTADAAAATTTLGDFLTWVEDSFPPDQAREIALAAATSAAKGDLEAFAASIATIVPPTITTTAAFADADARAAAGDFGEHVTTTVPSLAEVTAKFGDVTARGAISDFLGVVAAEFPQGGKAAEVAAKFRDSQARGDVAGFLTYVNTTLPPDKAQSLTAAFVDAQARLDAQEYAGFLPKTIPAGFESILKVDQTEGKKGAIDYTAWLGQELDEAGKVKLKAELDAEQTAFEFRQAFEQTIAPVLATGITDSILGALSGDDFSESWKGIFSNLASIGASQLDTALAGLMKGGSFKQSLQDAGLMSSTGKVNWAGVATTGGAMIWQGGQQRGNRGMSAIGGAISGAGMGFQFGGWIGAAVGAIVGGVMGYFSGGTRKEGYEAWFKPREDGRGMRFGMWVGNLGDDEEAEQARSMLSKYKKASGYFRDILDALGAPLGDWPAIEVDLKGKTEDFQTFWSTFLNGTLPRAVFDAYKPALVDAFADFGVETGRVNAELAKFNVMPFEEAAQALRAWVTSIVAVRDTLEITGLSFEDFKTRALEGTLAAWRRENEKTQADLVRWAGQLGDLDTEEQVEQAGKMVDAINRQIDANAKLLQTIDDLRQKYVASQASGPDLSIGAGGSDLLERVDAAVSDVVTALAGADTIEALIAAAGGAEQLREQIAGLAEEYGDAVADFNDARGELAALLGEMVPTAPLALEDALGSVTELMSGLEQLAPAEAAERVREVTALLQEQYDMQRANLEQIASIQRSLAASWDALFAKWDRGDLDQSDVIARQQEALAAMVDQIAAATSPAEVDRLVRQAQEIAGSLWDSITSQMDEMLDAEGGFSQEALQALWEQREAVRDMAEEIRAASEAQLEVYRQQAEAELELIRAAAEGVSEILNDRATDYAEILDQVQAADAAIADSLGLIGDRLDLWEAEIAASNELLNTRAEELLAALTSENGARQDLLQDLDTESRARTRTTDGLESEADARDEVITGLETMRDRLAEAVLQLEAMRAAGANASGALSGAAAGAAALATNSANAAEAAIGAATALRNVRDADPERASGRGEGL